MQYSASILRPYILENQISRSRVTEHLAAAYDSGSIARILLVILNFSLEVSLWMSAYRAYLRCFFSKVDITAIAAFPSQRRISLKSSASLEAFQ